MVTTALFESSVHLMSNYEKCVRMNTGHPPVSKRTMFNILPYFLGICIMGLWPFLASIAIYFTSFYRLSFVPFLFAFCLRLSNFHSGRSLLLAAHPLTERASSLFAVIRQFEFYHNPWWAYNPYFQTFLSLFCHDSSLSLTHRQWVETEDGVTIGLDWILPTHPHQTIQGIVMLLPGTLTNSQSDGVNNFLTETATNGFATLCVLNNGELGTEIQSADAILHVMRIQDVERALTAVSEVNEKFDLPVFLVGMSAGSIRALNFAGLASNSLQGRLAGLIAFSGSIDPVDAHFSWTSEYLYQPIMTQILLDSLYNRAACLDNKSNIDLKKAKKFSDLTHEYIKPVLRMQKTVEINSEGYLNDKWVDISIPTLIVHAHDDPVVNVSSAIQRQVVLGNSNIIMLRTVEGSHLDWCTEWTSDGPDSGVWMSRVATTYFNSIVHNNLID
jgi:predicted alpha/beta-fold hydrolase